MILEKGANILAFRRKNCISGLLIQYVLWKRFGPYIIYMYNLQIIMKIMHIM